MTHAWVYRNTIFNDEIDVQKSVEMGVFCADGVYPTHSQEISEELSGGISFDRMSRRLVGIHSMRFSPLNAQIAIEMGKTRTFFSLVKMDGKACLTYHVIPKDQEQSDLFENIAKISPDLKTLVSKLGQIINVDLLTD
eukprot:TRINITY_DN3739_c0_g1_i2.p1 TRINITY_DN3739_c0_g1~~TRINITY_DN3739_c0_g1_i2.p1  ORF type:complete len:138 (-),score=31.29 TRINITY_DN3739_c0_g1_i2:177-590(-)